jgi:hypothetical protein
MDTGVGSYLVHGSCDDGWKCVADLLHSFGLAACEDVFVGKTLKESVFAYSVSSFAGGVVVIGSAAGCDATGKEGVGGVVGRLVCGLQSRRLMVDVGWRHRSSTADRVKGVVD